DPVFDVARLIALEHVLGGRVGHGCIYAERHHDVRAIRKLNKFDHLIHRCRNQRIMVLLEENWLHLRSMTAALRWNLRLVGIIGRGWQQSDQLQPTGGQAAALRHSERSSQAESDYEGSSQR